MCAFNYSGKYVILKRKIGRANYRRSDKEDT